MSLWVCPDHGLYGGQTHCPECGKNGEYATLSDALNKPTTNVGDPFARQRCAHCNGTGREPWVGTGPWAGLTSRSCSTCLGKGWHKPGDEIRVGKS